MVMHFAVKPLRPETTLPPILRVHKWADVVWHREHPTGAVLVVFRLTPIHHYVASWLPCRSFKSRPQHAAAISFEGASHASLDDLIHDFAVGVYGKEPDKELWKRALDISAKYSENGQKKRGKTKNGQSVAISETATLWRQQFPGHHFKMYRGHIILLSRKNWGYVHLLADDGQGKDLYDWNQTGPTREMVKRLADTKGIWDL